MRALLDDSRTSNAHGHEIIVRLCRDRRDMGDVLALAVRRWDITRKTLNHLVYKARAQSKRHHVFETLINHPDYGINEADIHGCIIHFSFGHIPGYEKFDNPHLLPAILAHPLIEPDLRTPHAHFAHTALSLADRQYCRRYPVWMRRSVQHKRLDMCDVRLLLRHERVDVHKMTELCVDPGYDGLVM